MMAAADLEHMCSSMEYNTCAAAWSTTHVQQHGVHIITPCMAHCVCAVVLHSTYILLLVVHRGILAQHAEHTSRIATQAPESATETRHWQPSWTQSTRPPTCEQQVPADLSGQVVGVGAGLALAALAHPEVLAGDALGQWLALVPVRARVALCAVPKLPEAAYRLLLLNLELLYLARLSGLLLLLLGLLSLCGVPVPLLGLLLLPRLDLRL